MSNIESYRFSRTRGPSPTKYLLGVHRQELDDAANRHQVELALTMMRKAHIKPNAADAERKTAKIANKRLKLRLPYSDYDDIDMRSIRDIVSEARRNYGDRTEKRKADLKASKIGKPRRIFVSIIDDIKSEIIRRRERKKAMMEQESFDAVFTQENSNFPAISTARLSIDESDAQEKEDDVFAMPIPTNLNLARYPSTISSIEKFPYLSNRIRETSLANYNIFLSDTKDKCRLHKFWLVALFGTNKSFYLHKALRLRPSHDQREKLIRIEAVAKIAAWWISRRLDNALKNNPDATEILRTASRRFWCRMQVRRRRRHVSLIRKFLRDSRMIAETIRKMKLFRNRIVKVQKFFKSWLDIQQARVEVLWLAMTRIEKRRAEIANLDRSRAEREAFAATTRLHKFSKTMADIRKARKKVQEALHNEEIVMKRANLQILREEAEKKLLKEQIQRELLRLENTGRKGNASVLILETGAQLSSNQHSDDIFNQSPRKKISWYQRNLKNSNTATKIEVLRRVLGHQRARHVTMVQLEEDSIKYRLKENAVDMAGLKGFLSDPYNHDRVGEAMTLVFDEIPESVLQKRYFIIISF